MKDRKVLLTGATGRLGSVVRGMLGETGDVTAVSRSGAMGTLGLDLLRSDDREAVLNERFDLAVNTAAVASPSACAREPGKSFLINTVWPLLLALRCREDSRTMVHISTDLVYSGANPPYSEKSPAVPLSFYGWTKLLADILVMKTNPDALIVRTSVLWGETPSRRNTFSEELLAGRIGNVYVDSWRNHTPVGWLAGLLPELVERGITGLVIACGRLSRSRSAFAEELFEKHGRPAEQLAQTYAPPGTPRMLHLSGTFPTG